MVTEEDVIEGVAIEVPERGVTVIAQPGQALVAEAGPTGPAQMLTKATAIADALANMVEKQRLYTVINQKKYPHVEAWMTIGRMDNVVAREVVGGVVQNDDGSYEATVELVRLSDGMVIGRASALCGTKDDVAGRADWSKRAAPARRSMAVTRATSRAFRQQYSWIMALAGYEPTPADEMPGQEDQRPLGAHDGPPSRPQLERVTHEPLIGTADVGKDGSGADFELRETPDGWTLAFRLTSGRKGWKVIARDALAEAIAAVRPTIEGQRVRCYGRLTDETFDKADKDDPKKITTITYQVLQLERLSTDDFDLPAPSVAEIGPDEAAEVLALELAEATA